MRFNWRHFISVALLSVSAVASASSYKTQASLEGTYAVPAAGTVEVGFSPRGSGEALVVKAIESAHQSIKIASYSFTSENVVQALWRAKIQRHVNIYLVADQKDNLQEGSTARQAIPAFTALMQAGIEVRVNGNYPIMHNKFMVIDGVTVETGSFNYTKAAATKNAENVIVFWSNPRLALVYDNEWNRLYQESQLFRP